MPRLGGPQHMGNGLIVYVVEQSWKRNFPDQHRVFLIEMICLSGALACVGWLAVRHDFGETLRVSRESSSA